MRDLLLLAVQLIITLAKLARPGGVRSVIAESLLLKQQLLISRRSRRRSPPLTSIDRSVLGLMTRFVRRRRLPRLAAILKPATLLRFHKALVDRKYRRLFSSAGNRRKPGPKGPTQAIIAAIVQMKLRNPRFGYQRIAEQIGHAFGVQIDKDIVRRVLSAHCRPDHPDRSGPSWLTLFAQAKDSLWSADLFRCESILLRSHWVLVAIDGFTRRIRRPRQARGCAGSRATPLSERHARDQFNGLLASCLST
jgi:putative transposase